MSTQTSHRAGTEAPRHSTRSAARFQDILALATSVEPWSPAVLAAIDIAALWKSNVSCCYIPGSLREQRALEADPTVLGLLADVERDCLGDAYAFQGYAQSHGAHHTAWMVTHTAIAPTLRTLSAWHDLAVLERDMVDETRIFDVLGEAMLCSRIPCLVLPPGWNKTVSFKRIAVAWNGTFESTRALRSALPLLQRAKEVTLINGQTRSSCIRQLDVVEPDPLMYLMHHGVAAKQCYLDAASDEVGELLLSKARGEAAELLVMGGYGHSRIRERVLGGATRHVMGHADIPVLMQH